MRKLSDEQLLADLRELAERLGRAPTSAEMNEFYHSTGKGAGHASYFDHFGGWNEALERAGFEPPNKAFRISDNELCEKLRVLAVKLGRVPLRKDVDAHRGELPCAQTYVGRFGSWKQALAMAGFERGFRYKRDLSDEDLISVLQELGNLLGHLPSVSELRRAPSAPSYSTYCKRFGSWNGALKAAGFGKELHFRSYRRRDLIQNLRRLTRKLGHCPSRKELKEYSPKPCLEVYERKFGSLEQALIAAGFTDFAKNRDEQKREMILDQLKAFARREQRMPSPDCLGKKSQTPCYRTCVAYFGSWQATLQALIDVL